MISLLPKIRHKVSTSQLRVPFVWVQHRGASIEDVFLASYPRSGSTWLRFMLLEILTGYSSTFTSVNQLLPAVGEHHNAVPLLPQAGRLIKTHEAYRREYKKAVYLLRDPRDVALSEYAYEGGLGRYDKGFDHFLQSFVRGRVNGYGSWQHHVNSWLDAESAGQVNLLVVRFEDLRRNPEETMSTIFDFAGVKVSRQSIRIAVENNTLEQMKKKEDSAPQMAKAGARFVRSGAVAGWIGRLTEPQLELLERMTRDALLRTGYSLGEKENSAELLLHDV
jgi:hypothetical protein